MSAGEVVHAAPPPSPLPPPHAVIDLSQQYIKLDSIQSLISQYTPLYAAHGGTGGSAAQSAHQHQLHHPLHATSPLPTHVSFQSSALNTSSALEMTVLQSFLSLLSPSLLSLNLSKSNITGRLFFRGKDVTLSLKEAEDARVFIEGRESAASGRSIVRDDDPPLLLEDADRRTSFRYVSTAFNAASRCFTRTYAELNWLHLREVNVSSSELSSHGLTTLLCCTGQSLQVLRMNDCRHVDNSGVFTLTALCRHLHTLEISNCPLLTEHALIALADMPQSCIAQLSLLACCQSHIRPGFFTALLNALQDRGFQGVLLVEGAAAGGAAGAPSVRHIKGVPSPLLARVVPGTIMDLTGAEVTQAVLKTLTAEQLQSFTARKQALVQRMTAEQQRVYANITSLPSSCPAPSCFYALDLSLHHYINDTLLLYILQAFGPSLYVLKLSHTFVTAAGLSSLSLCRNLRVLSLSSCHSLSDKQAANAAMMSCIRHMPELMELNISDSRLSGRMLSAHPLLCLFTFYAHACPISTRALRLLSESCASSLFILSLSHCPFINRRSIFYILRLQQLIVLDLSCCPALTGRDCLLLEQYEGQEMRRLNIAGVDGVTPAVCRRIQDAITRTKQEAKGTMADIVEVIGEEGDGPPPTVVSALSSPAMLSSASDFNYQLVTPQPPQPVHAASQRRVEEDGRQFMRRDSGLEQKRDEEKVEQDGRRYEAVQDDDSGLYSVIDSNYAVAPSPAAAHPPPSVSIEPDDLQPLQHKQAAGFPSSSFSRPSHSHSASFSTRPTNPTPSRSQRSAAWAAGSSQSRPAARARQFPASQMPSAASSPSPSPPTASTPSATAATGGFLSHHQHHPHPAHQRPPHVSLPSSPMAGATPASDSTASRYSPMTEHDGRSQAGSPQQQGSGLTWATFTNHTRARSTADLSTSPAAPGEAEEDGSSSSSSSHGTEGAE